jgi:23S rRNA pseudouridine1911/1915/1917 synthase
LAAVSNAADLEHDDALALILRGGTWLGRHRVRHADQQVAVGQLLTLHFPPEDARRAVVTAGEILYEDDALLVLNKPPGVYVAMTPWDVTGDLLSAATRFLSERDGAEPSLHLAHRLDRDTSGVLLISKSAAANAPLQRQFLSRSVTKRYLALASGSPPDDRFTAFTGHGRGQHGLFRVYPRERIDEHLGYGRNVVKAMETQFEVLDRFPGATLIEARPITGRTHQIRLHLAYLGLPIAGDSRYDGPSELAGLPLEHHLLHAAALDLSHPVTAQPLHFEAPLPPLLVQVLSALRENKT